MTMLFLLNSMVVLSDGVLFHVQHLLLQSPSQEPPLRVQVRGRMTWVELLNDKTTTQPQRSKGQTFQATILQKMKQSDSDTLPWSRFYRKTRAGEPSLGQ